MKTDEPKTVSVTLPLIEGVTRERALAMITLGPVLRSASTALHLGKATIGESVSDASLTEAVRALMETADKTQSGNTAYISDALVSQAHVLDATVSELMKRAWQNAGEYPEAFHRYMTLALKAQSNCRTTLEALAKLHQPREQVIRHVHVYQGGQAVVAEEFHHHAGGSGNAGSTDQPQAPSGAASSGPAMLGDDATGNAVSGASDSGTRPVPDARRKQPRRAARKPPRP